VSSFWDPLQFIEPDLGNSLEESSEWQLGSNLHPIYQFNTPLWNLELAWSPDGESIGAWYQIKENDNVNGLLLDAAGTADPQSIEWELPVWWTPSFWPQWGR